MNFRLSNRRRGATLHTRREFIASSVLGGVSLAAGFGCASSSHSTSSARATTRPGPSKTLGVALLGLGSYSESQLGPALKLTRHCALRGIVTGSPEKIETWRKEYGIAAGAVYDYQSLPRIADNRDIDVVYVVTPTALHAKYSIMAAQAGKHVWCEKPMAMNVEECKSIIDACRANNVSLSIGYRMHHEPNTQTVVQLGRDKPYGAIRSVRAIAGDRNSGEPSWRMDPAMGGGALYDMGVYAINAIRYSTAEEPLRVTTARQWAERPELFHSVDENTEFELALPSGAVGYGHEQAAHRGRAGLVRARAHAGVRGSRGQDERWQGSEQEDRQPAGAADG
jgi:glucose-fructose oxidoreductase